MVGGTGRNGKLGGDPPETQDTTLGRGRRTLGPPPVEGEGHVRSSLGGGGGAREVLLGWRGRGST